MIAVWESDISATFLIFRLKCSTDAAASFQIIGAWFGQGQPSLRVPVSCKQSDAERKDFADIPEQGHSESLRGLERCRSTGWWARMTEQTQNKLKCRASCKNYSS